MSRVNSAVAHSIRTLLTRFSGFISYLLLSLLAQRTPGGLAHVDCGGGEPLLYATVAGDCGQYTTPSRLRRVQDKLAVRRNRRRFVECSLGQHLHLPCCEILDRHVEIAAVATQEPKALPVRKMTGRHVVAAVEG